MPESFSGEYVTNFPNVCVGVLAHAKVVGVDALNHRFLGECQLVVA